MTRGAGGTAKRVPALGQDGEPWYMCMHTPCWFCVVVRTLRPLAAYGDHCAYAINSVRSLYPPPPCLGTALRKYRPLVPRSNSSTIFFYHGIGFFMVVVDAGQLFRCVGQHFMCVATGPPIGGTLSVPFDPFHEATSP